MKYTLAIFLFISTISFAETCDTTIECSGNVKTTTIEISKDVYHSVQKKDYGRLISALLILGFVGYSIYLKRKKCK